MAAVRTSWRRVALLCVVLMTAKVTANGNNQDDGKWGLPGNNNNNKETKSDGRNSSSKKPKKNNSKPKKKPPSGGNDDDDDDSSSSSSNNPFKASFTFFPQSDLTSFNSLLPNNNGSQNQEESKEALLSRLQAYVRERMMDHDEIDKQVNRSRKEWEDLNTEQHMKTIQAMMKLGSIILKSPLIKTLMSSRDAQESLRQFVLSIKMLLEDPEKEFVLGDSERWHAMFERLKKWEGASQDSLLEILIQHLEQRNDNND
ncbi:expressed unknown protein [Seminavis robusta]|uniref:Uncharacterized protein n=1 Tax=Seminavis robusta TaxID=568900 RepID=A0A9N8EH47_9STRA|nr:expressed unknown protein [Seminavis robusta]|eukprot:Sro986_g228140.1 n/a (257) ;mRNA; f:30214-31178